MCGARWRAEYNIGVLGMSELLEFSVVIPAFNEARRLPETVRRISEYLGARSQFLPAEVLVVDDGSDDGTAAGVEGVALPTSVELRVLRLEVNRGKGAAVRTGMAASRGRRILISDADLATPIEDLEKLERANVGLAIGSRAVDRSLIARRQPLLRDLMGRCFNAILRACGLTRLADTQCGFKLLDGELGRRLAGALRIDGFAFDVELLARAERLGASIAEVPVRWSHVDDSRVQPIRHSAQMLRDVVSLRIMLLLGR